MHQDNYKQSNRHEAPWEIKDILFDTQQQQTIRRAVNNKHIKCMKSTNKQGCIGIKIVADKWWILEFCLCYFV